MGACVSKHTVATTSGVADAAKDAAKAAPGAGNLGCPRPLVHGENCFNDQRSEAAAAEEGRVVAKNGGEKEERIPEAPATSFEARGPGLPAQAPHGAADESSEDQAAADIANAVSTERVAYLRRLGMNRREVMEVLKSMANSIDPCAPMRVIRFSIFVEHGRIPRSDDKKTVLLSELPQDILVVFISHRWFRPWHTKEECEENGHVWAGMAHPDDVHASKHKLICDGVRRLAESKGWDLKKVVLWVDFAGVEQDDFERLMAGVASLRGYITLSDAILIPAVDRVPEGAANTVDMVPGGYGERAWTRLEAMSMYAVSVLKQVEAPEIFVAAGDGASFLERVDYVLDELPSDGKIFDEKDREYIRGHEEAFLKEIKDSMARNGYIAKHGGGVGCVAFDPKDASGDLVASGGGDGVIKLVNRQTGTAVWSVEIGAKVLSLAFNKDGSMLAAGRQDGVVRVWAVAAGSRPVERCTLRGHSGEVNSVAWNKDGTLLASGSDDSTVKIWDMSTGSPAEMCTLKGHSISVSSVAWNKDSTLLASGSGDRDKTVKIWDMSGGSPVEKCTLKGHLALVNSVAFSPDGKFVASGSGSMFESDDTVRIWDVSTGEEKGTLTGHSREVNSVAWSPDGKTLASGSSDRTIRLWDVESGEGKGTLTGHTFWVRSVAWSPDGKTLASGSQDDTVRLWDVESGEGKGTLTGHSDCVLSVAWNKDSTLLASGSRDSAVKIWDMSGGSPVEKCTLKGHSMHNPECTCTHGQYGEYEANTECPAKGHSSFVTSVAWSPDGKTLASGSDDETVRLWDVESGEGKGTLTGHSREVNSVAWSPDGKTLASGSDDKTVQLWDVESGKGKGTLTGHSRGVTSVAWSPDGKTLASGSQDDTVRLWDVESGEGKGTLTGHQKKKGLFQRFKGWVKGEDGRLVGTLKGHSDWVLSVAWNKDSTLLASGSRDSAVKIWDMSGGPPVEKCTLKGHVASWQKLDSMIKEGGSVGDNRSGQYIATADGDMVYVYMASSEGEKRGESLAAFRSPSNVRDVCCRGTCVVVGCDDGQMLFLEGPLLARAAG